MERLLYAYTQDFRADFEASKQGDYGSQQLTSKASPLLEKQLSWEELLDQYAISVGGITEDDGVGVSRERIQQYRLFIKDICKSSSKQFPGELTVDDARNYVNCLQKGSLAVATQ